ncbi:hypothetical protein RYZ26_07670 [Terasakiella sp. A23]|uniref:hypothetical protein n=1 Tax=Terasakiella sp. FCG-A23 TaxID=3080561 RepID=UPI0029550C90|nr:hypothetical protein [Terasakiella sp. A23]MDV7339465.1 hypothetical protein [Terasakiella sp. A23]
MTYSPVCNYLTFCDYSSTKVFQLVNRLVASKEICTPQQRSDIIERIRSWALSHIELKSTSIKLDGVPEDFCREKLRAERIAIHNLIQEIEAEDDIDEKEKILMSWFMSSFIESEERCSHCSYSACNQST